MPKSQRLLELMLVVNRRRRFTAKELAEEFSVSTRTIMRDLQKLSELGVPLYSEVGPHGGYRILSDRMLPPISFTEDEAIALFFAAHALRHFVTLPFDVEFSSVLNKFYFYTPEDVRRRIDEMQHRVEFMTPVRHVDAPSLSVLLRAAVEQMVVRIDYTSRMEISTREIQPIGIYARNGFWYCPAYCFLRHDFRVFRCDRITSAAFTTSKPLDLRHINLENRKSFRHIGQPVVDFYAELSAEGVERCETELWPASVNLHVRQNRTGWLDGTIPQEDIAFYAQVFVALGQEAMVARPQELIQSIRKTLSDIADQYR